MRTLPTTRVSRLRLLTTNLRHWEFRPTAITFVRGRAKLNEFALRERPELTANDGLRLLRLIELVRDDMGSEKAFYEYLYDRLT